MTELVEKSEMEIGYAKFLALRERQKLANTKYRATEKGKKKTNEMHRIWCSKKKDDLEYNQHLNMKARERYHARKLIKKAESAENEISLGESDRIVNI